MGLKFETSDETCAEVRKRTDRVILAFSLGKDSIAAWLQLRKFWTEPDQIIPVYQGSIVKTDGVGQPAFVEQALVYYENVFDTRIYQLTHIEHERQLSVGMYQPPHRKAMIKWLQATEQLRLINNMAYMNNRVRELAQFKGSWTATGLRITDSLQRRASIKKNGSAYENKCLFYPIWDWTLTQTIQAIKDAGLWLPIDYEWFGRSFDSLDYHVLRALHDYEPETYRLILRWFPLASADLFRMEQRPRLLREQAARTALEAASP